MNQRGNETASIGKRGRDEAEVSYSTGKDYALLEQLEIARRELAIARKRIQALAEQRELSRLAIRRLKTFAFTDALTNLVNRRRFDQVLDAEFSRSVDRVEPLSVIMVDVDDLKLHNDSYGHSGGDFVLCLVAQLLAGSARRGDVVARYGGDEFAILLRRADATEALECVRRFRDAMSSFQWPKGPVTASFGVATLTPSITRPSALLEQADRALYLSKRDCRTRVMAPGTFGPAHSSSELVEMTSPSVIRTKGGADGGSPPDRQSVRGPSLQRGGQDRVNGSDSRTS